MARIGIQRRTRIIMGEMAQEAELRLWQLISPALPLGAYAYSEGLESAISLGWVYDRDSLRKWLQGVGEQQLATVDLVFLHRITSCLLKQDEAEALALNNRLLSRRETSELRASDTHQGAALRRLAAGLGLAFPETAPQKNQTTLAYALAVVGTIWRIGPARQLRAYAWMWIENQVAAAIKTVPLGQTDGQVVLMDMADQIPDWCARSSEVSLEHGAAAFGLSIISAQHETQYTRLFRS